MPPIEFTGRTPFRPGVRRPFGATPISQQAPQASKQAQPKGSQSVAANLTRRYEPYPASSVASVRSRLWLGELDEGALKSTGPFPASVKLKLEEKAQVVKSGVSDSGNVAWILFHVADANTLTSKALLCIWNYSTGASTTPTCTEITIPDGAPQGHSTFVGVAPDTRSGEVSVIVVTATSAIFWPNCVDTSSFVVKELAGLLGQVYFSGEEDEHLAATAAAAVQVTAMAARSGAERGTCDAVLGMEDSSLLYLKASSRGLSATLMERPSSAFGAGMVDGIRAVAGSVLDFLRSPAAKQRSQANGSYMNSHERAKQQAALGAVRSLVLRDGNVSEGSKRRPALACMTEACVEVWSLEGSDVSSLPVLVWQCTARSSVQKSLARDRVWLSDIKWGVGDTVVLMAASSRGSSVQSPTGGNSLDLSLHTVVCNKDSMLGTIQGTSTGLKLKENVTAGTATFPDVQLVMGGMPRGGALVLSETCTTLFGGHGHQERVQDYVSSREPGRIFAATASPTRGCWILLCEGRGTCLLSAPSSATTVTATHSKGMPSVGERQVLTAARSQNLSSDTSTRPLRTPLSPPSAHGVASSPRADPSMGDDVNGEVVIRDLVAGWGSAFTTDEAGQKLQESGILSLPGETNPIVAYSHSLLDTLPKHWGGAATESSPFIMADGTGKSGGGSALAAHLEEKGGRYQRLFDLLESTRVLTLMEPSARTVFLEHGERLAAAIALRGLHNQAALAHSSSNGSYLDEATPIHDLHASGSMHPIGALVQKVGRRARECNAKLQQRSATEVYYSRVTAIESFFDALQAEQTELCGNDSTFAAVLFEMMEASSVILGTALAEREKTLAYYPSSSRRLPWTAHPSVRAALLGQVKLCLELERKMRSDHEGQLSALKVKLQILSTLLLDAYLTAMKYSYENGTADLPTLQNEYVAARKLVLGGFAESSSVLGSGLLGLSETVAQQIASNEPRNVDDEQASLKLRELLIAELYFAEEICERHCAYEGLVAICTRVYPEERLHMYMARLNGNGQDGGTDGPFAPFVFDYYIRTNQKSKLLQLPSEFDESLGIHLKTHWESRWLHELRRGRYMEAAYTQQQRAIEEGLDLRDRKRRLCLGKLAFLASDETQVDHQTTLQELEAQLLLLEVQLSVVGGEDAPLEPRALAEACLQKKHDKHALLCVFTVFGAAGPNFRRDNVDLLHSAWQGVLQSDDWARLAVSTEQADDAQLQDLIQSSTLCTALKMCYGKDSSKHVVGGSFGAAYSFSKLLHMIQATEIGTRPETAAVLQHILKAAVPDLDGQLAMET
mmetsp:Transcript_9406/g.34504  ORF Transcript_9406/g.34504 Transcript_9406/m.34504 type:complete len:1300 (-) Transcript_9406:62-3961(-)|eukprot:scaffold700_cov560-Prasinococcus_capsulatus_cf.AAC.3